MTSRRSPRATAVAVAAAALAVLSPAAPSHAASSTKEVKVTMNDIKFSTKSIKVSKGTTVTFVFENKGKLTHEAMLAPKSEQAEHDEKMAKMNGMTMPDTAMAVSVKPGATKKITYTFAKAEKLEIGCHIPGHYAAGMKIEVVAS